MTGVMGAAEHLHTALLKMMTAGTPPQPAMWINWGQVITEEGNPMKLRIFCIVTPLFLLAAGCAPSTSPTQAYLETSIQESADHAVPTASPTATRTNSVPATSSSKTGPTFDFSQNFLPIPVSGSYQFAEGPATDPNGNVYFSDINAGKIYKWLPNGSVTMFLSGLNMPNGLMFDKYGNLIACEGGNGRLISIDPQGQITVLADQYNGIRFNEPNDLWITLQGGIYFTDPAYQSAVVQGGEYVYYISPDRSHVTRVIDDMVRPNGIVGTADGKMLYVADFGAGQTFVYDINNDGTLANKLLFVSTGSDGIMLDAAGNLYLTTPNLVQVYDSAGAHMKDIPTHENPTNVTFAGKDGQTLFITARTAVYTVHMSADISSAASGFTLTSPDMVEGGALPAEYTCDGVSATLALAWSGAPTGTVGYAIIMHHVASPTDVHWYWVLYNIPADMTSMPKNSTGIGTLGTNSVNDRLEYSPPCSKGPGPKIYTYTVYALSAEPNFPVPASQVNRAALLEAIKNITLASAELNVTYTRK
jgi:gluconolactonase